MQFFKSTKSELLAPSFSSAANIACENSNGDDLEHRMVFLGLVCRRNLPEHFVSVKAPLDRRYSTTFGMPLTEATHNGVNVELDASFVGLLTNAPRCSTSSSQHFNMVCAVAFRLRQTSTRKVPPLDTVLFSMRHGPNLSKILTSFIFVRQFLLFGLDEQLNSQR
mmetsp:Transcript_2966/g.5359  ORF Transcript_2966/g.5359 Transcript_2966/m.5359 type:complete len:165 (-) Transcript_2966:211-705(-)